MNKVFKVIWNEARSAYVVVSEIAKNHGSKSCSTKKLLAMLKPVKMVGQLLLVLMLRQLAIRVLL